MRNLTIKRTKSFVASLGKMKVYIEDENSCEIFINNMPCRKLGDLKNGEEKTFQVGEEAARIYVIADKLSKDYCNEFYQLPAGTEDVYLTGKNIFSPGAGNPFRFDGNDSAEVTANRKKGFKRGLVVLVIAIAVGFLIGYAISFAFRLSRGAQSRTFTAEGMSITLTNEFRETNIGKEKGFLACYDSENVAVFVFREVFLLFPGLEDYTEEEYADLFITANHPENASITESGGRYAVVYENGDPDTGEKYRYKAYIYKTDEAFWVVQFAADNEYFLANEKLIDGWAKSVKFSG